MLYCLFFDRVLGTDQRLVRLMETCLLIMESFTGFESKFSWTIVGHSGDGPAIPLVEYGKPPQTRKERLKVLQRMYAHSQYCASGDYTLEAIQQGQSIVINSAYCLIIRCLPVFSDLTFSLVSVELLCLQVFKIV